MPNWLSVVHPLGHYQFTVCLYVWLVVWYTYWYKCKLFMAEKMAERCV